MTYRDNILDDLFQGCALQAFLEQARRQQDWPDMNATKQRAYQLYEETLAEKNRQPSSVLCAPQTF